MIDSKAEEWIRHLAWVGKHDDPSIVASAAAGLLRELLDQRGELLAALKHAEQFISNGIELGYITMPDADCPDSAHDTPRLVRAAIAKADGKCEV
jgi:hypothetical protein